MFIPIKQTEEISSMGILARLLRDYDEYVLRSLQRDYTPEQLGITKQYASYVLLKNSYNELLKAVESKQKKEESDKEYEVVKKLGEEMEKLAGRIQNLNLKT